MSFLETNDRIVNLANVSNVNVLHDKNRIIFNMNYSIEIDSGSDIKMISDYAYWDAINSKNLELNLEYLCSNEYFKENFIGRPKGQMGFVNMNEISSVKFSEKKNRVIFNLSHPVTFRDYNGDEKVTSEFVYVNCRTVPEYDEYVTYVKTTIARR